MCNPLLPTATQNLNVFMEKILGTHSWISNKKLTLGLQNQAQNKEPQCTSFSFVSEKHQESMTLTKYKQGEKNVQYKRKCMISLRNSPTSLSMATSRTANYISKDGSGKGDKNKGSHLL